LQYGSPAAEGASSSVSRRLVARIPWRYIRRVFTGLVVEVGTLREVERSAVGATLEVSCALVGLQLGESIAVDGACLTVTRLVEGGFRCDASAETLAKTTLDGARKGQRVHLERALRLGDRLGGHLVTGHVDGVGGLVGREPLGDAQRLTFEVPDRLAPFLAPKGSVAVDGVSLTVNGASGNRFDVVLVPYTRDATHLGAAFLGKKVNVEVDVLAKYVARLLGRRGIDGLWPTGGGVTLDLLERAGYL
jgi:riboflavin synthase